MIILDPIAISDASLIRATPAYAWDALGRLQQWAPNQLRVTYDPSDLSAPPYALVEPASENLLEYSYTLADYWSLSACMVDWEPDSTAPAESDKIVASTDNSTHYAEQLVYVTLDLRDRYTLWMFVKAADLTQVRLQMLGGVAAYADFDLAAGQALGSDGVATIKSVGSGWYQCSLSAQALVDGPSTITARVMLLSGGQSVFAGDDVRHLLWGGAQMEKSAQPTSYIRSNLVSNVRAADVISDTGTFLYSSVIENDAPPYSATDAYALDDQALDVTNHLVYASNRGASADVTLSIASPGAVTWMAHGLVAGTPFRFRTTGELPIAVSTSTVYYVLAPSANTFTFSLTPGGAAINTTGGTQSGVHTITAENVGRALTDETYWRLVGASNVRKMVDQYNNTQTEAPEQIILTLRSQTISQGLFLGNLDASEIQVTAVNPETGKKVYSEVRSQVLSNSEGSAFNWHFKPLRRQTYFFTALLPVYNNSLVTIIIKRKSGTAKCGICALGPLIDIGISEYGLSSEIKDYSSVKFNFDGTSTTQKRGFGKRLTLDVAIPNWKRDTVEETLIEWRQKPVVWVGATFYGSAIAYGTYGSFKNLLGDFAKSRMSLQINGMV